MQSASFALGPYSGNYMRTFLRAQWCTEIQHAPKGTDLRDKVCIITGASGGLGLHAAHHLLNLNLSHLIIAVRSAAKGDAAAAKLRAQFPSARIEVWAGLEMTSYSSIQAFAQRVETTLPRLDMVILNAGASGLNHRRSEHGHEENIQINYYSTALLAILLLPSLRAKSPAGTPGVLTFVGSALQFVAKLPNPVRRPFLASLDDTKITPWDPQSRYGETKLLLAMFFTRLYRYLNGDEVTVNIIEPGFCKGTDLGRDATGGMKVGLKIFQAAVARKAEDGAWMHVYAAALAGRKSHGCYLQDWETRPFPKSCHEENEFMDNLWQETMAEFEFAGVREILASMKSQ